MNKKLFFAAFAGLILASCANDDYIGSEAPSQEVAGQMFTFGGESQKITRDASTGADAAALLGNKFRVLGTMTKNGVTSDVFDNYVVKYDESTKGVKNPDETLVDSTNAFGWTYLGETSLGQNPGTQYVKYWDLQASQYDFIAFSGIPDSKRIASNESNTLNVDLTSMQKLFISNKVIADYSGSKGVQYGNPVRFTFNRMAARVRVGFYETVPGYAVTNVRFYFDGDLLTTNTTLAKTNVKLNGGIPQNGEYVITYDANNVAVADYTEGSGTKGTSINFGTLQYKKDETEKLSVSADGKTGITTGTAQEVFLATSSAQPTWAKGPATLEGQSVSLSDWQSILPYPGYGAKDADDNYINRRLTLRVDYDLVPLDGGPVINVYNASAVIPYAWTLWKPNYAYTYIFKISDQTSGSTLPPYIDPTKDTDHDGIPDYLDPDTDPEDMPTPDHPDSPTIPIDPDTENPNPLKPAVSPIQFDAEVSGIVDFNQETITGLTALGGNSITTHSSTSSVTDAAEYAVGETITVSSPSHGRWGVAFSATPTTEQAVADNNTFTYTFLAGEAADGKTIDENSVYEAQFTVTDAGYYVVWLRYLPTGMTDVDSNYVDVFKIIKTHN